jgi:hypothetical protein
MKIKNMTKKRLEKILLEIMPSTHFDKKTVEIKGDEENNYFEMKANCSTFGRVQTWFNYYQDENKKWVLCMDSAFSYDLISTDAEFGQCKETVRNFNAELEKVGYYPDPINHYSFTICQI